MGTTVRVCFPAVPVAAGAGEADGAAADGQTVLVVDDEPEVLAITARMLRRGGYRTLEAASCDEALSLLSAHEPQLLLTDSVMPGMAGLALADQAKQLRPGLRVLNMTGSEAKAADAARAGGAAPSILKPFTAEVLLDKVRSVLGS
jgi:CheY-like chemotaxis protein